MGTWGKVLAAAILAWVAAPAVVQACDMGQMLACRATDRLATAVECSCIPQSSASREREDFEPGCHLAGYVTVETGVIETWRCFDDGLFGVVTSRQESGRPSRVLICNVGDARCKEQPRRMLRRSTHCWRTDASVECGTDPLAPSSTSAAACSDDESLRTTQLRSSVDLSLCYATAPSATGTAYLECPETTIPACNGTDCRCIPRPTTDLWSVALEAGYAHQVGPDDGGSFVAGVGAVWRRVLGDTGAHAQWAVGVRLTVLAGAGSSGGRRPYSLFMPGISFQYFGTAALSSALQFTLSLDAAILFLGTQDTTTNPAANWDSVGGVGQICAGIRGGETHLQAQLMFCVGGGATTANGVVGPLALQLGGVFQ